MSSYLSATPSWPPHSAYEAAQSSPNSRRKLNALSHQPAYSTSPSKQHLSQSPSRLRTPLSPSKSSNRLPASAESDEDEEDEEILQLRLEALEAKLKLKQLQKKRQNDAVPTPARDNGETPNHSSVLCRAASMLSPNKSQPPSSPSKLSRAIQIPLSPERQRTAVQEQQSPRRLQLGIDKGRHANQVSLKRAPVYGSKEVPTVGPGQPSKHNQSTENRAAPARSFNDRLAMVRQEEKTAAERRERLAKIRRDRPSSFVVEQGEIDVFKAEADRAATQGTDGSAVSEAQSFTREQILGGMNRPQRQTKAYGASKTSAAASLASVSVGSSASQAPRGDRAKSSSSPRRFIAPPGDTSRPATPSSDAAQGDATLFEGFSCTNLARRVLPHSFVKRIMEGKSALTIPALLRDVKAPDYCLPPEIEENDYVVFGIIASKSNPLAHKDLGRQACSGLALTDTRTAGEEADASLQNRHDGTSKGNYLALTLTDLVWSVDLFLFGAAFPRFRKLEPGTLIAILNPAIMPPRPSHARDAAAGKWSLSVRAADDHAILEIGTAKDLGWCRATKRDGHVCNAWLDRRKTEFCDFHVDLGIGAVRSGRMEVQGPGLSRRAQFNNGNKGANSRVINDSSGGHARQDGLLKEGRQYDWSTDSTYYIARGPGSSSTAMTPSGMSSVHVPLSSSGGRHQSAAALLDAAAEQDTLLGATRGLSREERLRQKCARVERERDIARALGVDGDGAGAAYLRARSPERVGRSQVRSDNILGTAGDMSVMRHAKAGLLAPPALDPPASSSRNTDILDRKRSAQAVHLSPVRGRPNKRRGDEMLGTPAQSMSNSKSSVSTSTKGSHSRTSDGPTRSPTRIARSEPSMSESSSSQSAPGQAKKTRFVTAKGIREAGRESLGTPRSTRVAAEQTTASDDELDIVA